MIQKEADGGYSLYFSHVLEAHGYSFSCFWKAPLALLYSRKPAELVQDFNKVAEEQAQTKVRKTIDQFVQVEQLQVDLEDEARKANAGQNDILAMLKRIHKI